MDRFTLGFVLASLVYFFLAAVLGIWMGMAETTEWVKFAHVHFNLLGFMAMMIYGVGYFILPRFNARTIKWPRLVPVHFIIANLGLIGMVFTASERPSKGFTLFAIFAVLSVLLFVINLGITLLEPQEAVEMENPTPTPQKVVITDETRVGEILSRWPETLDILVANGFKPLADPAHREKVMQLPVTLGMACERHELDCDLLVNLLNKAVASLESAARMNVLPQSAVSGTIGKMLRPGDIIGHQHVIGDILGIYPATEKVFKKYYGAACFSCPGQATETIRQSAMMHNVDEKKILAELNEAAGSAR